MSLSFQENGNLIPGIHLISIEDFENWFGYNSARKEMIQGLKLAISWLKECGCKIIYIDGSFVTTKVIPGDFDACWDANGVDLNLIKEKYPLIIDFSNGRANQKFHFKGELFPAQVKATPYDIYLNFFQADRDGKPKGIVQLNIG